ncbi:MAG: type I site-specific restriction endonuclease [Crocinitomicaceae bacterium]
MIEALNFPKANLTLKRRDGLVYVWCIIRKKELVCTPEEWVRQHAIHYLIHQQEIAIGLIASEYSLTYNGRVKRADIVVFNRDGKPEMLVECKATSIKIDDKTVRQIAQYNFDLNVDRLFLTNGNDHVFCTINRQSGSISYDLEWPYDTNNKSK